MVRSDDARCQDPPTAAASARSDADRRADRLRVLALGRGRPGDGAGERSRPRSTRDSTSSTPPTSTASTATSGSATPRSSSARCWRSTPGCATAWCWRRRARSAPASRTTGVPSTWCRACESSLRRLRVELIDLYQLHRPDVLTHPEEVADALNGLVDRGLVAIHRPVERDAVAVPDGPVRPRSPARHDAAGVQHLAHRAGARRHLRPAASTHSVTPLAWSPLGGGDAVADERIRGARRGARPDRRASRAWTVGDRAGVRAGTPCGSRSDPGDPDGVERIEAARGALEVRLERTEWYDLYQAATGERLP